MNVYRVEHSEYKIGPYQGMAMGHDDWSDYWSYRHPGPRSDGLDFPISDSYFFGFKSIRQLLDWFLLWDLWKWRKKGFAVYRYSIADEHVRIGGHQLVFVRAQARSRQQVRWLPFG